MSAYRSVAGCTAAVVLLVLGAGAAVAVAQQSKSSAAAARLAGLLDKHKLDSIAAPDPADPQSFVGALYFSGAQLLLVSAKYSAPSLLTTRLASREYREIYIDLNSASIAGSKVFVMDAGADGLSARPDDGGVDTWEKANTTISFDGDWRAAKLSEQEYLARFAAADEQYARLLTVLADYAEQHGGSE